MSTKKSLNRKSYIKTAETLFDNYKNLGYNYKGKIFRHTVSGLFYLDPRKESILDKIETMIYELIEQVKMIKKFRNPAIDKDSYNIN